jgi:hypothetical protein
MKHRVGISLIVLSAAILVVGLAIDVRTTLAAYLVAWVALASVPIGGLGVLMTSYLVRRAWTEELHDILVAAVALLPAAGILFIPILLGMSEIYPAAVDRASMPWFRSIYLEPWFFSLRSVIYFVIWSGVAIWVRHSWREPQQMARAASVGLIIFALSVSLAGVDWIESIEPEFHSSIFGLLFIAFVLLNGIAFGVAAALVLNRGIGAIRGYSALLLATILLWAYLHAMQYIVIWSANIPDEVAWYIKRSSYSWQWLLVALAVGQLILPFFALLSIAVRASRRWLLGICAMTLAMRGCESALLILPPLHVDWRAMWFTLPAAFALIGAALWLGFERALANDGRPLSLSQWRARAKARPQ